MGCSNNKGAQECTPPAAPPAPAPTAPAPAVSSTPPASNMESMMVQCPEDATVGSSITVATPGGQTLKIEIPAGVSPGQEFMVQYDPAAVSKICAGKLNGQPCKQNIEGLNFCRTCGTVTKTGANNAIDLPLKEPGGEVPTGRACTICDTCVADASFCPGCGTPVRGPTLSASVSAIPMNRFSCCLPEVAPLELSGGASEQLTQLLAEKPFVDEERHFLNHYVRECRAALQQQLEDEAVNALDNLSLALGNEERTLAASFRTFDRSRDGVLKPEEVRLMMEYCGFPSSEEDLKQLFEHVDRDHNGNISFEEYLKFVGKLGGSIKLYDARRKRIASRRGSLKESARDESELRLALKDCGIQDDALAEWRLVESGLSLDSTADMEPCQKEAVRRIRALAQENHERTLPLLRERVTSMGYSENDLTMALLWIRDLAPIIVHINIDKVAEPMLNDTHYRNQFETATSSGLLKPKARIRWEGRLFGTAYDDVDGSFRPRYAVQNICNDPRGVMACKQYGDSYIVLNHVRLRCTMSGQDSANLTARRLAVLDFYAHALQEYSDKELVAVLNVSKGGVEHLGDSQAVIESWGKYKEAQVHGEIRLDQHVRTIVVNERHRADSSMVEALAAKHGWILKWMDDFAKELDQKSSTMGSTPSVIVGKPAQ